QHSCKLFPAHYTVEQVWSSDISNEEGIPGKDSMLFSVLIQQEEAGRFRGVAWCVQYFDREASNANSFPVGGVVDIVVRFGFGTVHDRGSRSRGKINVTRYEEIGRAPCKE